eukprot:CAMPEP_0197542814 /NCGR_PEP_ID=MMETSP1318-20131121/67906_1 /TAXON_ID=552666 /ORGANISM="Partenskyella glossopodia, Strain RCC365" /LENGTH=176 /DNA_ID=CAMNT_0043102105 /DNA_START=756 /DNA_END=1284 /DNA_ORIENTATION=+
MLDKFKIILFDEDGLMLLNDYQYQEDVYIDYLSDYEDYDDYDDHEDYDDYYDHDERHDYEDYEDDILDYPRYQKSYVEENEDNSNSETFEEDFPWMLKEKKISHQEPKTNLYLRNSAITSELYDDINREYDGLENIEEDFDIDEFDIDVYLDWYYDDLLEVYKLGLKIMQEEHISW